MQKKRTHQCMRNLADTICMMVYSNNKEVNLSENDNKTDIQMEYQQKIFKLINLILKKWGFSQLTKKRVQKRSGNKRIDLPPIYQLELIYKDNCEIPDGEQLFESLKQNCFCDLLIGVNYLEEDE
jgi:hypothetical protein